MALLIEKHMNLILIGDWRQTPTKRWVFNSVCEIQRLVTMCYNTSYIIKFYYKSLECYFVHSWSTMRNSKWALLIHHDQINIWCSNPYIMLLFIEISNTCIAWYIILIYINKYMQLLVVEHWFWSDLGQLNAAVCLLFMADCGLLCVADNTLSVMDSGRN